jgi:hypothetical protein
MARYGTVPYGTVLYDDSYAADDPQLWCFAVDWNADGIYDGNESMYIQRVITRRGRKFPITTEKNPSGGVKGVGWEYVMIGEAVITLNNKSGRFDVYNTSSPLYPNIRRNKNFFLRTMRTGDRRYLITGVITDIYPVETNGKKQVILQASDCLMKLNRGVHVPVTAGLRTDQAIQAVLDAVDFPAVWSYELDSTPDYQTYFWADDANALGLCHDLAHSSMGEFFSSADGKYTFYNRYQRADPVITLDESDLGKDISIQQPWSVIFNKVTFRARPRTVLASQEVWRLSGSGVSVEPGETIYLYPDYTYEGESIPVIDLVTPAATTDFVMNSADDESGSNLTGNFSVAVVDDFAMSSKISITNNGGTTGYLILVRLRAKPVAVMDEFKSEAEDSGSQALYDISEFEYSSDWLQDIANSASLCNYTKTITSVATEYIKVIVYHHPEFQFKPDLFSYIRLDAPSKFIDNELLRVAYIEHETITENLQDVTTVFYLEPTLNLERMFTLPAQLGITTYLSP